MLYMRKRDMVLVATRIVDTIPSLLLTCVLHIERFPLDLLPTQFHLRASFAWFGAFFGCVTRSLHPYSFLPTVHGLCLPSKETSHEQMIDAQYALLCCRYPEAFIWVMT